MQTLRTSSAVRALACSGAVILLVGVGLADVVGELTTAQGRRIRGKIRWQPASGVYLVTQANNVALKVAPKDVTKVVVKKPAEIDGASHFRIFLEVVLPLSKPGLNTLAIFSFLGNYKSFFWPLVMIKDDWLRTLPIGMLSFNSTYGQQTELVMAATVMCVVPLIVLFVILQKQLVRGIQLGAVKG